MVCMFLSCIKENGTPRELEVGDLLPDFTVTMNDGSTISDDDIKAGVSVVMFFHTTCPDCQKVLPRMQMIYDEYSSEGVSFTLISRQQESEEIEAFWSEKGLTMPYSAQKDRKVYEKFAQSRIPRVYVNEKGGIIRYIFTDTPMNPTYDDLKSAVEDVIR